jgi:hypothetical protein
VTSERSPSDEHGRVVRFRQRGTPQWRWPSHHSPQHNSSIDDFAKFERSNGEDDYRHRMRMNILGLVATLVLVFAGLWLAVRISEISKVQDCFLSGRRNCAPIEAGPSNAVDGRPR